MRKLVRVCLAAIRNFFLPREVCENYLEYVKWKLLHRVFSSALQVLATQVPSLILLISSNFLSNYSVTLHVWAQDNCDV